MALLLNHYRLLLCPAREPFDGTAPFVHVADTRLELEWDEPLFAAIGPPLEDRTHRKCQPRRLPQHVTFRWHDDDGLRDRTCDARGQRLTYVTAGELVAVGETFRDSPSEWNRAVYALLHALSSSAAVILFWQ